jgi:hypothetical protein
MNIIHSVVANGKIEIAAPPKYNEGDEISLMIVDSVDDDAPMTQKEIDNFLNALKEIQALNEGRTDIEDLSAVAREAGEFEKQAFEERARKIERMFD